MEQQTTQIQPIAAPVTPPQEPTKYEKTAAVFGKFVNEETAIGKSGKTFLQSGGVVLLLTILSFIVGNPALFPVLFVWHYGVIITIAEVILVFFKNISDSQTPNF